MRADLHIHSRCSDGSLTVEEIVELAAERGLDLISLTDHDTVDGTKRAYAAAERFGISCIPGIEISAWDPHTQKKIHILGYAYRMHAPAITTLCTPLLRLRNENTLRQIAAIHAYGLELSEEEVQNEAGESPVLYKQHIMAVLVRKGYTSAIYSPLYSALFKGNGVANGDIPYLHYRDAIAAILEDGGVPVLAHPGPQASFDLVEDMVYEGLRGIESDHPEHDNEDREKTEEIAERYGLIRTGGSDFHGIYGSPADLGEVTASVFSAAEREDDRVMRLTRG